jgi:adenosylhomocysteine nucleosidase
MADLGRIGLVAVHRELLPLRQAMREEEQARLGEALLCTGWIGDRAVALADVLPGPVHAALGAQALVIRHQVDSLISFGSAGALAAGLSPGDLVVGQRAIAHDAGRFLGQRFEPAGVMGRDRHGRIGFRRAFEADPDLVESALAAAHALGDRAQVGTIVTGNQVVFATARKQWLRQTFDALAVEMETAAVAQVAVAHGLPWVAVRAISDSADDDFTLDYSRLGFYLDDERAEWRCWVRRWVYLATHPDAWRRVRRLSRGLALASQRAARLVEAMLRA